MQKHISRMQGVLALALGACVSSVAATEISPSPTNLAGNLITISTPDITSYAEPYENYGEIRITNGGKLSNFGEFTHITGTFNIDLGGQLVNNKVFTVDFVSQLNNAGTISNYDRFKISWSLTNLASGVLTNNSGALLTNTRALWNLGSVKNDGDFVNSYSLLSQGGGSLSNSAYWNNKAGSTFTNYAAVANHVSFDNAGYMVNNIVSGGGGVGQGMFENYAVFNNLAGGVVDNLHRWFNRPTASVINNSGTFNNGNGAQSLGLANEGAINNLAGGAFNNFAVLGSSGQISNAGTFDIKAGGSVTARSGVLGTYQQTQGLTRVDGSLAANTIDIQGGALTGSGVISGPVFLGAAATMNPGNSPGMLTMNGDLTSAGKLIFEIAGLSAGQYDELKINGAALFNGGTLEFDFLPGFNVVSGNSWDFLFANSYSGQNSLNVIFNGLAPGLQGNVSFNANRWSLSVTSVPVPAAVWLFASGVLGLLSVARRRVA